MIVSPVPAVAASENELERVVLDVQETVSVPLRNLQPENRFPLSVQEDGISPVMDSSAVHPKNCCSFSVQTMGYILLSG